MSATTDWVSICLSMGSLALAGIATAIACRSDSKSEALARRQGELAEFQTRLSERSWSDEYFRELEAWAADVVLAISEAVHLTDVEPIPMDRLNEVRARLSASIDTGRWYFPNSHDKLVGQKKEPAYRGYRQKIPDHVVDAYTEISKSDGRINRHDIVHHQRCFVSAVQMRLDPKSREQVVQEILNEFAGVRAVRSR